MKSIVLLLALGISGSAFAYCPPCDSINDYQVIAQHLHEVPLSSPEVIEKIDRLPPGDKSEYVINTLGGCEVKLHFERQFSTNPPMPGEIPHKDVVFDSISKECQQ